MKTIEVGAFEAKNKLSHLLALAEKGQQIFITRRGRRVAAMTAAEGGPAAATSPGALLKKFEAFRAGSRRGPESLKQLIDEGR